MSSNRSIPVDERSPSLKTAVRKYVDLMSQISQAHADLASKQQHFFFYLAHPWLVEPAEEVEVEAKLAAQRKEYAALGFPGDSVKQDLERIMAEDRHLTECCATLVNLGYLLDIEFISYAAFHKNQQGFGDEEYDQVFDGFSEYIYSEPFKTVAASHLYNFDADDPNLMFEGLRLVKLDAATISTILGEPTSPSFIHPHGVGQYFIVTEQLGPTDDLFAWLHQERIKATEFTSTLQYFKDGVVHVDYSVPHFFPLWVNQIRKRGIFYIGDPHRLWYAGGKRFYHLDCSEAEQVNQWWRISLFPAVAKRLGELRNRLRQAMMRAGTFYESHYEKQDATSKLIDLAIALEAFFSPSKEGELTHRMAQAAGHLVGESVSERKEIFRFVRDMYSRRSALFHGQYDVDAYSDGKFVSDDEIEKLASIIRRSMLRFLVLFIKGSNSREEILSRLVECTLDQEASEKLIAESDPIKFIEEYSNKLSEASKLTA
jgi:hypothetical protein